MIISFFQTVKAKETTLLSTKSRLSIQKSPNSADIPLSGPYTGSGPLATPTLTAAWRPSLWKNLASIA